MKHLNLIAILIASLISGTSFAQIKYSGGKLNINNAPEHTFLPFTIKDWPGFYWACKSSNFFQLDISPNNPRISGTGDAIAFYNTTTNKYNSIQVANVYNYSDLRAKENIQSLTSGLDIVLRLRPVSYNWKQNEESGNPIRKNSLTSGIDSVNTSYGPSSDDRLQLGFLAQEVEEILPNAVITNESGSKLINYTAMIPLLVQAIQELQEIVETQSKLITELTNDPTLLSRESKSKILSCTPNPALNFITVHLQLSEDLNNAKIVISNITGNRETIIDLTPQDFYKNIDISSLPSGIHIVSLYTNNVLIDSCRLAKE